MSNTPFFSTFLSKASIIGISCSGYLYSIYTLLPEHFYDPLITVFIPIIGVISSSLFPKMLRDFKRSSSKGSSVITVNNEQNDNQMEEVSQQQSMDESLIQEMIEQKISNIAKEFSSAKQQLDDSISTINNVKGEIDELKKTVNELKTAFETTLVDLKAFQSEITNPLNFMRKYVESLDIKSLSDPLLPLQSENIKKSEQDNDSQDKVDGKHVEHKEVLFVNNDKIDDDLKRSVNELVSINLNHKISLANMMELIASIGESIKIFGTHYHNVLSTQCKILGLDKEREEILYRIADALNNTKAPVDAYIDSLYRLATILGIKDARVDAIYLKLKRKRDGKNKHRG